MRDFLLELGVGFSFVRANYNFDVGGRDYFVDLLFYQIRLRCYVVIQLEMGEFQPEQSGLMNFYLSAIDERERLEGDNPTIGIILCKTKNRITAEYSLRNLSNPIAVAEHRLPKSELPEVLPSTEELESELLRSCTSTSAPCVRPLNPPILGEFNLRTPQFGGQGGQTRRCKLNCNI